MDPYRPNAIAYVACKPTRDIQHWPMHPTLRITAVSMNALDASVSRLHPTQVPKRGCSKRLWQLHQWRRGWKNEHEGNQHLRHHRRTHQQVSCRV